MIYNFLEFNLNTETKELSTNGKIVETTKQFYELLLLFLENPDSVFSKDKLIEKVWQGRYVTENTIDQSISKLRKLLNSVNKDDYIRTEYGKGFRFIPNVTLIDEDINAKKSLRTLVFFIPIILIFIGVLIFNSNKEITDKSPDSLLLIISDVNATNQDAWLNQASVTFVDQLLEFSNASKLKYIEDKPDYQDRKQYIDNQWKISPDLKVVTTQLSQEDGLFTVTLNISDKLQKNQSQTFSDKNLGFAMRAASKWLTNRIDQTSSFTKIESLIPDDSYLVELYMRGLASHSKGEINKAEHFFQLCLEEKPDFYLARLQLADVLSSKGQNEKSLAILDTLSDIEVFPQIEIEIESIRANIYDTQGKFIQARDIYLALLSKFAGKNISQLNNVRYNLSFTYVILTEYEKALTELNKIESSIVVTENSKLLANVLQKKSSILQKLGHTKLAKQAAEKSLVIFSKLQDLLGEAKAYSALARITTHQSKYDESVQYLEQSLLINEKLNYKLGIGATLNELIYVLMVQGQFSKAWQLNQDMQKIAIEIDYNAMLLISKQYSIEIARSKKEFLKSEIYLQQHLQQAQEANNKREILKNKLFSLDLYLDQENTTGIEELILQVQQHIDESGEIRLQPRVNKQLARYYFLTNKADQAIALLSSTKELAENTEDGEVIIEINNLLAQHYLQTNQAKRALAALEESFSYQPVPYPYLLLKSKANKLLGNTLLAQDLANECKISSHELWSLEDERFLNQLSQ